LININLSIQGESVNIIKQKPSYRKEARAMNNKVLKFNPRHPQPRKVNTAHNTAVTLKTGEQMNSLNKFLAGYCGCADVSILQQDACRQDRKKYVTIGTSVLFTALLASCSGGFGLFTAFKSVELAAGFGVLWGAVILNIDRAMLINMTPKKAQDDTFGKKLFKAVPRLILSVAIGVVISTPLTLKIFEQEINAILKTNYIEQEQQQSAKRKNQEKTIKVNVTAIELEIQALQKRRATAEEELTKEIGGKVGSRLEGDGPTAKSIRARIADIDKEISKQEAAKNKELKSIVAQLAKVDENYRAESQARESSNGLLDRIAAREQLKEKNHAAGMAIHGLEFLLIAIEVAPLLIKLMAERGNYEEILVGQQGDSLRTAKDRQMYQHEIETKEEAIEYQLNLLQAQKKLLGIQADSDPKKLDEYLELVKTQFLKIKLNKQLFKKVMGSIENQSFNEEAFDAAIDSHRNTMSDAEIESYKRLFTSLKDLDRDILAQVITNLGSKPQSQTA
jgi:hypothetical protein